MVRLRRDIIATPGSTQFRSWDCSIVMYIWLVGRLRSGTRMGGAFEAKSPGVCVIRILHSCWPVVMEGQLEYIIRTTKAVEMENLHNICHNKFCLRFLTPALPVHLHWGGDTAQSAQLQHSDPEKIFTGAWGSYALHYGFSYHFSGNGT